MLKKSWGQARDRSAQPIDASYVRELRKLLETLTKAGKLEEAILVKSESQKVAEDANAAAIATNENAAKGSAQLESLRKNWMQARNKAVQPSDAIYTKELQKLQESFTKAGKLEEALAVKGELEKTDGPSMVTASALGASKQSTAFVGKKWRTASGSAFIFKSDGTGIQANAAGKEWPLKWSRGSDDLVLVDGWLDDQKATLYFQFTKSKEGVFGSTSEKLDKQVSVK